MFGVTTQEQAIAGHFIGTSVIADANGATNVPGVWATGNVTDPSAHLMTAAAAGLSVGVRINADLIMEEMATDVTLPFGSMLA